MNEDRAVVALTKFSPAEAERITGVQSWQRRDWRRRGYLPTHEGHARMDVHDLAEELAFKLLADRIGDLQKARDFASICGAGIAWHALGRREAYAGDHDRVLEWDPERFAKVKAAKAEAFELLRTIQGGGAALNDKAAEALPILEEAFGWGEQATWLRRSAMRGRGIDGHGAKLVPGRYFVLFADDSELWCEELDKAFGMASSDPRLAGPVLVLDLAALASVLLDRAGRPLVHVEIPAGE